MSTELTTDWKPELIPATLETINGRPALQLPGDGRTIGEFAEEIGAMLREQPIFARQGCAFALNFAGEKLEPAGSAWLRTWAEKTVVPFIIRKPRGGESTQFPRTMTEDTARAVLVSPQFLDQLRAVEFFNPCRLPVIRKNGKIELLTPGYDAESLTFTHESAPDIVPTSTMEARAILAELLEEFPFVNDNGRSKAVAVGAMLTVFASRLLPKGAVRPCFIYMANAQGAGKTMLARLACVPYITADVRTAPTTEEEFQKVLLAAVISGRKVLLLDNLKGHLKSPNLESFLTTSRLTGRVLGLSKEYTGDADMTVLLTGNGVTFSGDMRRRSLVVELFMPELRAENRKFKRVLDDPAINAQRPKILAALWQLIQDWDHVGRPKASGGNSSFPHWCDTIGGIVEYAGYGCPTAPAEIEGAGDTDTADIVKLVEAMPRNERFEFIRLVELASSNGLFDRFTSDVETQDGSLTRKARSSFSKALATYNGRQITTDKRFFIEGKGHNRKFYVS